MTRWCGEPCPEMVSVDRSGASNPQCLGASAGRTCLEAARPGGGSEHSAVVEVAPLIRRVIAARVRDRHVVDDLVQEAITLVRASCTRSSTTCRSRTRAAITRRISGATSTTALCSDPPPGRAASKHVLPAEAPRHCGLDAPLRSTETISGHGSPHHRVIPGGAAGRSWAITPHVALTCL